MPFISQSFPLCSSLWEIEIQHSLTMCKCRTLNGYTVASGSIQTTFLHTLLGKILILNGLNLLFWQLILHTVPLNDKSGKCIKNKSHFSHITRIIKSFFFFANLLEIKDEMSSLHCKYSDNLYVVLHSRMS